MFLKIMVESLKFRMVEQDPFSEARSLDPHEGVFRKLTIFHYKEIGGHIVYETSKK
jgi:hypothetical protein